MKVQKHFNNVRIIKSYDIWNSKIHDLQYSCNVIVLINLKAGKMYIFVSFMFLIYM